MRYRSSTGQRKVKRCPSSGVRGGPHAAAMRLDNGTGDRQSQPGAVWLGGKERVEDLVSLVVGQPHAGIGDGNQH